MPKPSKVKITHLQLSLAAHSSYLSSVFEGEELAMQLDPLTPN
jgi:hypothetical protein